MRILYTGGGTLGSVTPLLALAENDGATERLWIGTPDGPEKVFVEKQLISFQPVHAFRLRRFFTFQTFRELPYIFSSYIRARRILKDFRPDVVITAGSFVGVPVCVASKRLGIPYVVMQLDVRPGLANKILFSKAAFIVVPHEDYKKRIQFPSVRVCGIPTSEKSISVRRSDRPTIVIIGGGTGAHWLNQFVQNYALKLLLCADVIHLQGNEDRAVPPINEKGYVSFFHATREQALESIKKATFVITRAGMGTLSELAIFGKPAIVIPIPHSHQEDNVRFFSSHNAIRPFNQHDGFEHLFRVTRELLNDTKEQRRLSNTIIHLFPHDAVLQIKKLLHEVYEHTN